MSATDAAIVSATDAEASEHVKGLTANREKIAQQFLCGEGLEIGALDKPLIVPKSANLDVARGRPL